MNKEKEKLADAYRELANQTDEIVRGLLDVRRSLEDVLDTIENENEKHK